METLKGCFICLSLFLVLFLSPVPLFGEEQPGQKPKGAGDAVSEQKPIYAPLPAAGQKVPFGVYYLIFGFDKKPKLGAIIMKVECFTKEGKKDTSFEVKADAGMPSMRGAHETGDRSFTLSKKGDYLLPINIVMPGDWEIRLTLLKGGKVIFRGRYNFDV